MALLAHYINKGHSLEYLLNIKGYDRLFFIAAMEVESEVRNYGS